MTGAERYFAERMRDPEYRAFYEAVARPATLGPSVECEE